MNYDCKKVFFSMVRTDRSQGGNHGQFIEEI